LGDSFPIGLGRLPVRVGLLIYIQLIRCDDRMAKLQISGHAPDPLVMVLCPGMRVRIDGIKTAEVTAENPPDPSVLPYLDLNYLAERHDG